MFLMFALCRSPIQKTLGISQPIHSTAKIYQRAFQLKELGGTIITVDQTSVYDMVCPLLSLMLQHILLSVFSFITVGGVG